MASSASVAGRWITVPEDVDIGTEIMILGNLARVNKLRQ